MSRQTPLEDQLSKLVPVRYEPVVERRQKISAAIEEFYQLQESNKQAELTPLEKKLARSFVAAAVYEFVTDNDIYRTMELQPTRTSITECGKAIEVSEVRRILLREEHNLAGLGIVVWKISKTSQLVPFLDYVIQLIFDQKYIEIIALTEFSEILSQSNKPISGPPKPGLKKRILMTVSKRIDRLNDSIGESALKRHNPLVSYRLFLYIQKPSTGIWLKAWETLITSGMSEYISLGQIMRDSAGELELNQTELETFRDAIFSMETRSRVVNPHVFMGNLAKRNDRFVDLLVHDLPSASPAKSMDIVHGLLIAAQENPYATRNYLDVVSNKDAYPHAQPEYFIVGELLGDASKEALVVMIAEAGETESTSKPSFHLSRQRAAKEMLNSLVGVKPSAFFYLLEAFKTIDNPNSLAIIAELIKANNRLFARIDTPSVIERLITIAGHPISILRDVTEIDPISRNLRAFAIKTAVEFILSSPEQIQKELLSQFLGKLLEIDNELVARVEEAEKSLRSFLSSELKSIYFTKYVFGEDDWVEADEWLSEVKNGETHEKLSGLIFYLLQNILYGQLICLDTMVNSTRAHSSSSFQLHPSVEKTFSTVKRTNKDFLSRMLSSSTSFWGDYESSREVLNHTLTTLEASGSDENSVNSSSTEHKITIPVAEYCFKFLTVGVPGGAKEPITVSEEDKWIANLAVWELIDNPPLPKDKETIDFLLRHLYPRLEEKSWLERFRTGDFPPHEVVVSRINSFVSKSVIRSPLMTEIHLTRILEAAASNKVAGKIRSYDVILSLLELKQYSHKILAFKHLDRLLLDKSHKVVGASLFVIGEIVDDIGDEMPADLKNQLVTTIQNNCARAKLRNHKMFGGIRGLPISTARRMSTTVLSKLMK